MVRTWKQALVIVQPETNLAVASPGIQAVLEGQVQSGCSQAKVAEETVAFIKELAGIIDCGVLNGSAASCSSWVFACANARSRNT